MSEIPELTKVKVISLSTETGKAILQLEVLTPFPIEKYNPEEEYYLAIGETKPDRVPEFNKINELT
jgi:hypothetical protein